MSLFICSTGTTSPIHRVMSVVVRTFPMATTALSLMRLKLPFKVFIDLVPFLVSAISSPVLANTCLGPPVPLRMSFLNWSIRCCVASLIFLFASICPALPVVVVGTSKLSDAVTNSMKAFF